MYKIILLDLGCGMAKRHGHIGIDRLTLPGVDVVCDLERKLPFADNSIDKVYSKSLLEHIEHFIPLMSEIYRILKPTGTFQVIVPHFSSPLGHSDFTHKRFFGYYSFDYFVPEKMQIGRRVPDFYTDFKFRILEKKLRFRRSNKIVGILQGLLESLVNRNQKIAEFYEECLCFVIPCYSISVLLSPLK